MSLSASLNTAVSSLATLADQTSVLSRNVARAGDPTASRKTAQIITVPGYGVRMAAVTRVVNDALFTSVLNNSSSAAGQRALVEALDKLEATINDTDLDFSPAALVQKLNNALQQYSSSPESAAFAQSAVAAARDLSSALNSATTLVQDVRSKADAEISSAVSSLNTLLSRFETVNKQIVKGTINGSDVTDYQDQRDALLLEISQEVGIRTVARPDGGMNIYTESGVTLFDVVPRQISFQPTPMLAPGVAGNIVYADGVPITGSTATMGVSSGRITGLVQVRDDVGITYQNQLDELARGLIVAFSESDQSATPALADATGLFSWNGGPGLPPSGSITSGLAGTIRLNAAVDPDQGGDVKRLRDGGMNGAAYVYNSDGVAGYTGRLDALVDQMRATQTYSSDSKIATVATLVGFASNSAAWLEEARRSSNSEYAYRQTVLGRASESLNKITGVNLDEEMALMLELERSFQASSKVITTIDSMLASLLAAVR
ncbi:flagellar hook-associated protein FlgK [Hyphomicrobium sulfonivorans]|uniref:flagellar hook-associated protein FlgK n=1 Tax=Hyphomicrobium sulfonivorans TaxID=121290 RepID=UPI000838F24A|nr:flagellar hook-associated protein FlgK [Hyphomicrobium sulfonivorans]